MQVARDTSYRGLHNEFHARKVSGTSHVLIGYFVKFGR